MIGRRIRAVGLRTRMVACFAVVVLILGVGGTLHARVTVSQITSDELDQRGLAVARDVESRAGELLLTNDIFGLYRRIKDLSQSNPDVRYIVVFDSGGAVKASTFSSGLPLGLRDANGVQPRTSYSIRTVSTSEGDVRDVAYEIQGGNIGTVRVGLSTLHAAQEVDSLTMNLLALTGGAFIGVLGLSFVLATMLTRPLSRLAAAARAVGQGERPVPQQALYVLPEVGPVARAFDDMTQKLQAREEERGRLLGRVIKAQEDERMRISRELHDEAGQGLTSVLMGLGELEHQDQENLANAVATLRSTTRGALDGLRALARDLRPSILDDLGLVPALERHVADWGRKTGLDADFHAMGFGGARLSPEVETSVYRIAQEALTNVARHAQASSVGVLLELRSDVLVLVVSDDGVGMPNPEAHGGNREALAEHLGIAGMHERAGLIGGCLRFETRSGSGTELFLTVPLAKEPQ